MGDDVDLGVDFGERRARALGLWLADPRGRVDDLALQVREIDAVEIDDAQGADTGGGEVHQHRRAEAPRADHQHLGVDQPRLPDAADLGQDDVARVALQLGFGEIHSVWPYTVSTVAPTSPVEP